MRIMKDVAAVILNRNLPDLTDELGQWMIDSYSDILDVHVIENGSDADKCSKFASIRFQESFGPIKGINEGLKILLKEEYEYFWVNYNDARYEGEGFIRNAVDVMKGNNSIGLVAGYWEGNVSIIGKVGELELLSFLDPLGFVVSRKALETCLRWQEMKLDPLWDSSNSLGHYNFLATALALYESGMCMVSDKRYAMYEKREVAASNSVEARGFDDKKWKEEIGPSDTEKWLTIKFPGVSGSVKEKKVKILTRIEAMARKKFPDNVSSRNAKIVLNLLRRIFGR